MNQPAEVNIMAPPKNETLGVVQGLKVVSAEWQDDKLIITVEGPTIQAVTSPDSRKMAYNMRVRYGMANAGIDDFGGPYPFDPDSKKDLETAEQMNTARNNAGLLYRIKFRLTASPV